ncbi:MAG: hypothetical protein CMH22_15985 [Methylophaga sp.]|nr:hypothetical protein [Methylophaga sp.]MAX53476.1 hypothetical protein [Methylophaga sp.]|tara:strand:- start:14963 stop:15346 length:384 start_codon:yes stop_codon:yes gene_type:complete
MSNFLVNVRNHLDAGNLLDGFQVQYYKWNDARRDGRPMFVLRRPGPGGASDYLVQRPQVLLILISASERDVRDAENSMHEILRYLRGNYKSPGIKNYEPLGGITGPTYTEDGRGVFQLNVQCLTDDQ